MPEERIVSETVMGSSNPIARFGRSLGDSVRGIVFGFILILVGFGLLWWSENQTENSKIVAPIPVQEAVNTPVGLAGLVKLQGVPTVSEAVSAPKVAQSLLYYEYTREEFKKVKKVSTETRMVQRDGQDVQQQVEKIDYVDEWVPVLSDKKWAGFALGSYSLNPSGATLMANLQEFYNQEELLPQSTVAPVATTPDLLPATKMRERIVGLPLNTRLLVVGAALNGAISAGEPFIITDKSNDELIAALASSEKTLYWGTKIAAWLCLTIGFMLLFGPIATLLNILPGLGSLFNFVLFIAFGLMSLVLVALGTIVIRYWWAVLIVIIGIIAWLVRRKK